MLQAREKARSEEAYSPYREGLARVILLVMAIQPIEAPAARPPPARVARTYQVAALLSRLHARDTEVRGHEAAHMAAGGRYVRGGASFSYEKGPDGRQYAVGGEVGIDTAPIPGKPAETLAKMQTVRAAALAPSEPSAADAAVAAAASQAMAEAVAELSARRAESAAKSYGDEWAKGQADGGSPGALIDLFA
jgi:hypothetical protein